MRQLRGLQWAVRAPLQLKDRHWSSPGTYKFQWVSGPQCVSTILPHDENRTTSLVQDFSLNRGIGGNAGNPGLESPVPLPKTSDNASGSWGDEEQQVRRPLWDSTARQSVIGRLRSAESPRNAFVSFARWRPSITNPKDSNALEEIKPLTWRWTRSFAQIYDGEIYDVPLPVISPSQILHMLQKSKEQLIVLWRRYTAESSPDQCFCLWQDVMLWALERDIDRATSFVDATISDSGIAVPRYVIEDALKCIVSAYSQAQVAEPTTWDKLHNLVRSFAAKSMLQEEVIPSMPQKIVYLLLQHSDDTRTQRLYETLAVSQSYLHPYTLTRFMDKFAQMGKPDLAMNALAKITAFSDLHARLVSQEVGEVVRQSCITLLRTRFGESEWYRIQSQLATDMLEMGIHPNIAMLNTMILNAVEAGDYQTAQAIVETARLHGIRRDTVTYSILLKGASERLDESLIANIMQMAEEDGALPRNDKLVACLVATILRIQQESDKGTVTRAQGYRTMLRVYARYADTRPLWDLGIYLRSETELETSGEVSSPSPQLLGTMIIGYIALFGRVRDVQDLYFRYQSFVAQDHPLIAPTAETDYVANSFLLCLGRDKSTFKVSSIILKNMLEPSSWTTAKVAPPTVKSWTIALASYILNGQRAAADAILHKMRETGTTPNNVTWNAIISGHAGAQDVTATVDAMKSMESAGFGVDSDTLTALNRFRSRDQLLEALRNTAAHSYDSDEDPSQTMSQTSLSDDGEDPNGALEPLPPDSHSSGGLSQYQTTNRFEDEEVARSHAMADDPEMAPRFRRVLDRHNNIRAAKFRPSSLGYVDREFMGSTERPFETFDNTYQSETDSDSTRDVSSSPTPMAEENDYDHLYNMNEHSSEALR
ncbi:MAG: hypothetical protein Q9183_001006 [Haloplaca sp. 2 TL-2023]